MAPFGAQKAQALDKSWAGLFRENVLPDLPVERVAPFFTSHMGRPTKELYAMLGGILFQQAFDLTDEETVSQMAFNLQWHYALDIPEESDAIKYLSAKTLWSMRKARTDVFFAKDGTSVLWGPVTSRFYSGTAGLQAPTYVNWSLSWEQRLPGSFYFRNNWVRRTGRHVWAFDLSVEQPPGSASTAYYELSSGRSDTYSYLEWTVTRTFRQKYSWLGSYAWSRTRASSVVDSSIDNPVFGEPSAGPLPWDTPGRAISWGTMPVPRFPKLMLAYFVEWHSGFPYSSVTDAEKLLGPPNSSRFPNYFSLNIHCERQLFAEF